MFDILQTLRLYPDILQLCGVLGSILYVGGFALLQTGRICGNGPLYSGNQLIAATLVLISLVGAFNLGAFLIQIGFFTFGLIGLIRRIRMRRLGLYPPGTGVVRSVANAPTAPALQGGWTETSDWQNRPRARGDDRSVQPFPVAAAREP